MKTNKENSAQTLEPIESCSKRQYENLINSLKNAYNDITAHVKEGKSSYDIDGLAIKH